jgi:NADH-quinone oxidoreductase subunit J
MNATFVALLQVIVYAGAIMVLFLFVVMMLNIGKQEGAPDIRRPPRSQLIIPVVFAVLLLVEALLCVGIRHVGTAPGTRIGFAELSNALYGKHYLAVELASLVLLIGIIGGIHFGRGALAPEREEGETDASD